ncbi:DUF6286 domain-containing protein [Mycobacterium sp. 236(2023)]|uniref:DUF6286 domain-containing protein n=1 Tax=Mycobacterium sp. 236(2023) TaxID=3038163 RepID=UPI002414D772|nr:DUF6286 domain-containing protein [Mycobacterium sp. 236(2023)]MDG4663103.1 DUF6286 domain-containing protein [Mycobacterium sp. 236(2023)]
MTMQSDAVRTSRVRTAPRPAATAGASYVGAALAVVVTGLGALGIREALIATGWVSGGTWVADAVAAVDGAAPPTWLPVAAIGAALLGVALIVVAVKPRRKHAVPAQSGTAVYVDLSGVARVASAAAEAVPGVVSARTTASKRTLTVRCEVTGKSDAELKDAIARAATEELAGLARSPRVKVLLSERN